jgi:hypothetical protein
MPASRSQYWPAWPFAQGASVVLHTPLLHVPLPHEMPQPPQLFGSLAMSMHIELKPCGQHVPTAPEFARQVPPEKSMHVAGWQKPFAQNVFAGQLKQLVDGVGRHCAEAAKMLLPSQMPTPVVHAVPHAPQFCGS